MSSWGYWGTERCWIKTVDGIVIVININIIMITINLRLFGKRMVLMALSFSSTSSSWSRPTWGYLGRGGCWWHWPAGSSRWARAATWQRTLPGCPGYRACFRCCPGYRSSWRCCPGAWGSWCFDNFVVLDIDHVWDVVLEQEAHDVLTTLLSWRKIMFLMLSWTKMVEMLSCPRLRCLIVIGFEDSVVLGVWHVDALTSWMRLLRMCS